MSCCLLRAPYGGRIASMVVDGQGASNVSSAFQALRSQFAEPLGIDEHASEARMSVDVPRIDFTALSSSF